MDPSTVYYVNCGLSWVIVALSAAGYFVTLKRLRKKWLLWVVLGAGWWILAMFNTLVVAGIPIGNLQLKGAWLSSYVLVFASLLMLFLKVVNMLTLRPRGTPSQATVAPQEDPGMSSDR